MRVIFIICVTVLFFSSCTLKAEKFDLNVDSDPFVKVVEDKQD